jgi:hypothetical protein
MTKAIRSYRIKTPIKNIWFFSILNGHNFIIELLGKLTSFSPIYNNGFTIMGYFSPPSLFTLVLLLLELLGRLLFLLMLILLLGE